MKENTPKLAWTRCDVGAAAHSFLSGSDVERLFAHMQKAGLEPQKWGTQDGAVRLPFSMQEVLEARARGASTTYFKRQKAPRFEGDIGAEKSFWIPSYIGLEDFSVDAVVAMFATAAGWAGEGLFDLVVCGGCWAPREENGIVYRGDTPMDCARIGLGMALGLGVIARQGPIGLAHRTYLGARYVKQFGEELLLRTPGVVVTKMRDGLMLDLGTEPWTLPNEEVTERWNMAMNHLRPAGIFAVPNEALTQWTKGPNCQIAYAPRVMPK